MSNSTDRKVITETKAYKKINGFVNAATSKSLYDSPRRIIYARTLSVLYLITSLATFMSILEMNSRSSRQSLMNWDLGLMIVTLVVALLLSVVHKDLYWYYIIKRRNDNADERQVAVRQRVFTLAYRMMALVVLVMTVYLPAFINGHLDTIQEAGGLYVPLLPIMFLIYALPSAIASWQKDA